MSRAIQLARKGEGRTSPNPPVGALIVKQGKILAEGYHKKAGGPHAEIEAIKITAQHHQSQIVLIGNGDSDLPLIEWNRFINLFGGPVYTTYPLETEFLEHLELLGHNQLPDGVQGSASDRPIETDGAQHDGLCLHTEARLCQRVGFL